jgi:hypothetical protein
MPNLLPQFDPAHADGLTILSRSSGHNRYIKRALRRPANPGASLIDQADSRSSEPVSNRLPPVSAAGFQPLAFAGSGLFGNATIRPKAMYRILQAGEPFVIV